MDPNDYKTIESFVKDFEKVSEAIKQKNPDNIIAPMLGAIPFIDVLNIINHDFPNHKVEYVPGSNKIHRVREVLRGAFENLIRENAPNGGSFLSIDEVVSGNSLVRVYKQFDAARTNYANAKTIEDHGGVADFTKKEVADYRDRIVNNIKYETIAIVHAEKNGSGKPKCKEYQELLEKGIVTPVNTPCIITMDRTDYFPVKYKREKNNEGKWVYLPVIQGVEISDKYLDFLKSVSDILGKDSNKVTVSNLVKIMNSYKWVPEELRHL